MSNTRTDALIGFHFGIEIDSKITGSFTEASGFALETAVTETKSVREDGTERLQKLTGRQTIGELTLKRTFNGDKSMWEWVKAVRDGRIKDARTTGSLVIFDQNHVEQIRYNFTEAWPSKWSVSDLDAGSDDAVIETLVLAVETLERTK